MSVVTIAAVGVAAVLLVLELKGVRPEYGSYLMIAAGFFIFFYSFQKLEGILETIRRIQSFIQIQHVYIESLAKMVGITYVAEFASGICKDAGCGSLGTQIEIFGKLSVLAVSTPILLALLETLEGFLS